MKVAASLLVAASVLFAGAHAQVPGNTTAEKHLPFPIQECTKSGCTTLNTELVFDANWRWVHDGLIEGVNPSDYGLSTTGDAATLNFVTNGNVGSRSYILNGNKYHMFKLLGKELSFDIDTSNLYCGMNGAVYLIQMDADGGMARYPNNKAGASYGMGYCDAQCPSSKYVSGKQCCMEMDLWEANKVSTQIASHSCTKEGPCSDCTCDSGGCFYNTYKLGAHSFYGPGSGFTVDSSKKMTVVTQYITDDGTPTGKLTQVRRLYKQNGKVIEQAKGTNPVNYMTDAMCPSDANYKLAPMGKALQNGMVLSLSLWTGGMAWLDSGDAGTCTDADDQYNNVVAHTDAKMTVSNIRFGDIGTTYGGGDIPTPTTSTPVPTTSTPAPTTSTPAPTTSTPAPTTSTPAPTQPTTPTPTQSTSAPTPSNGVAQWGQCGGINYSGSTTCKEGKCVKLNDYYYQCQ